MSKTLTGGCVGSMAQPMAKVQQSKYNGHIVAKI